MTNTDYIAATQECLKSLGVQWNTAAEKIALAASLGDALLANLSDDLDTQGAASLVVSGGSTPAPVFEYMSNADLDWSNVSITLADERWVPLTHPDSNEALVRNTLMVNKAADARFVSLYLADTEPDAACRLVADNVRRMASPFTAVVLGMGNDGHTASLFPDAPAAELNSAMDLQSLHTVSMMHPPSVEQDRITLTRAALLNAKNRYLHMTGSGKCQVLHDALQDMSVAQYRAGDAPITGLVVEKPERMSVFWSP